MSSNAAGAMPKAKSDPRSPSPVDVAVGRNVHFWRLARGLSQTQLADRLGVTFQQVQKYETGHNRVSMGRLVKTAAVLRIPISALFEGTEADGQLLALISDSRSFRLAHAFAAIKNNRARLSLANMVEKIAASVPQPKRRRS
jgi:transcriptional regulator with XRE-family HTH domain